MISQGNLTLIDDTGKVQLVQIQSSGVQLHSDIPVLMHYGFSSNPHPGAQAVFATVGDNRQNSVVVAVGDTRYRIAQTAGEVCIHDDLGQQVRLTRGGIVINAGSNPLTINASGGCIVNGSMTMTGTLTATNIFAGSVDLLNHVHNGVQLGAANTGGPHG